MAINYNDVVRLPNYRNLVVNPDGASTYSATWRANNGTIKTSDLFSLSGGSSMCYTVTEKRASSYSFGPFGPAGNTHVGRFKIAPNGAASFKVSLRSPDTVWVKVVLLWFVKSWPNGTSASPVLSQTGGSTDLTEITKLDSGAGWKSLSGRVAPADVPRNATHFQPLVFVQAGSGDNAPAPGVGVRVFADEAFAPDNGAGVSAVPVVIGGRNGARWEGDPNNSTSTTVALPTPAPEQDPEPPTVVPDPNNPGGEIGDPSDDDPDAEGLDPPEGSDEDPTDAVDFPVARALAFSAEESPIPPAPSNPDALPPWGGPSGAATVEDLPPDGGWQSGSTVVVAERAITYRPSGRFNLNRDVQISNLVMNSVDSNGITWIVSDIEGWWTMPEPDVPDQPRSWFDGSFETRGRHTARTFTLSGSFIPPSPSYLSQARDRLIRAINLVHRGGWFMTHEDPVKLSQTRGSKVWMSGAPLIATTAVSGKTDFAVTFRAPDPTKYGIKNGVPPGYESVVLTTSGVEYPERAYNRTFPWAYPEAVFGTADTVAINYGNVVVFPILRMRGPTNGAVRVINSSTGQSFRISRQLHEGEELVIDCKTKQVTMNGSGNFRFYLDIDVDWLMFQPGENKLYFREEELGGIRTELEVLWRSGWIG